MSQEKKYVLVIASYITDDNHGFFRTKTGYGYAVKDHCQLVSERAYVKLWLLNYGGKRLKIGPIQLADKRLRNLLWLPKKIFFKSLFDATIILLKGSGWRSAYSCLFTKQLILDSENVQVFQFHGVNEGFRPILVAAIHSHKPIVYSLHGILGLEDKPYSRSSGLKAERDTLRLLEGAPNSRVTVMSEVGKEWVEKHYPGLKDRVRILPNYIQAGTTDACSGTRRSDRRSYSTKLLCVGRIMQRKGQLELAQTLLDAENELQGFHLEFVGGVMPKVEEKLRAIIKSSSNFSIRGHCPRKDLGWFYRSADIVIVYSSAEGFGLPVIEALATGTPVIISKDADLASELSSSPVVRVVERNNCEELVSAISELKTKNFLPVDFSKALQQFTADSVLKKYVRLLDELV